MLPPAPGSEWRMASSQRHVRAPKGRRLCRNAHAPSDLRPVTGQARVTVAMLLRGKLRLREVVRPARGHTARNRTTSQAQNVVSQVQCPGSGHTAANVFQMLSLKQSNNPYSSWMKFKMSL